MHQAILKHSFQQLKNQSIIPLSYFAFGRMKEMQKTQKPIDFQKPSIKVLTDQLEVDVSLQHLRKSHQFDVTQSLKIFRFKRQDLSIGQLVTVILDGDLQAFQQRQGFEEFKQSLENAFQMKQQNLSAYELHLDSNLQNFLKISMHLQKHTTFLFSRIMLAFLVNYIENYENLPKHKFYKAMAYLTDRCYISQNMIKHFKKLTFDFNIVDEILKSGTNSQIKQIFETISGMIESISNIQKWQKKGCINSQKILQNIEKQQLIATFFKLLKNPVTLPIVLSIANPSQIFITELFQQYKKQYFQIIGEILKPSILTAARINENLVVTIFDNLYIYSIQSDKQEIIKILNIYTKSIVNFENDGNDIVWGGNSLTLLCQKFQHFSTPLFNYIILTFLKIGTLIKCNLPLIVKKNKVHFKNLMMIKCFQLGSILKIISGNKVLQEPLMIDIFSRRFQAIVQIMQKNEEAIGAQNYLFQGNQQQIRSSQSLNENTFNHYQQYDEFYVNPQSFSKLIKTTQSIEKQLKIKFEPEILQQFSYPITSKLNIGARVKVFVWNAYYYSYTSRNLRSIQQIYNLFDQNSTLMKMIEEHIAYPGLLEGLFLLYHSVNNRKLLEQARLAKGERANQVKSKNSLIQQLLKKKRSYINQQYHKFLANTLPKEEQELLINPLFVKNIQMSTNSIRAKPSVVYKNENELLKVLKNQFLSQRYLKYEKFRKRFTQQLRALLSDNLLKGNLRGFSYFVDYPFVADFYLIYRNSNILILFISPKEKMFLESLDESKQQKDQQKNKNRYISSYTEQCIRHFRSKSFSVILISREEEIKNLRNLLAIAERKK